MASNATLIATASMSFLEGREAGLRDAHNHTPQLAVVAYNQSVQYFAGYVSAFHMETDPTFATRRLRAAVGEARSKGTVRGFSADTVILDEAQKL